MEQQLLDIFPDENVPVKNYQSFIYQPERIQISSVNDISTGFDVNLGWADTGFNSFTVRLPRPAINVKSLQLSRATIPNVVPSFPDSQTTFWYYGLPIVSDGNIYSNNAGVPGDLQYTFDSSGNLFNPGGGLVVGAVYFDVGNLLLGPTGFAGTYYTYDVAAASPGNVNVPVYNPGNLIDYFIEYTSPERGSPRPLYLRYIRLAPSWAAPELLQRDDGGGPPYTPFQGGFNRQFVDYDDLVSELNLSCADDFLEGTGINGFPDEFRFIPNDIIFSYSSRFSKIVFSGLNMNLDYLPVALDDQTWKDAAIELRNRDRGTSLNYWLTNFAQRLFQDYGQYNLNYRLGFTYATYNTGGNFLSDPLAQRPYQGQQINIPPFKVNDHVAPQYCDLVYTSCVNLYTDVVGGSTVDSVSEERPFLGSIPINTTNNGVAFHSLPLNNPLTKIPTQLNTIYIEMRTDTGEKYYIGNNAVVSLELILTY
jgi:hypothetical protein